MNVGTSIPKDLRCPHDNSAMEFAETANGRPTWVCEVCEIDYTLYDLIVEGDMTPSFVVLD